MCFGYFGLKHGCFSAEEKMFTSPAPFLPTRPVATQIWLPFVLSDEKFPKQAFKWGSLAGGRERQPSA